MSSSSLVDAAHEKNQQLISRCMKTIDAKDQTEQTRLVNERDSGGRTALHYAALNDLQALAQWMLSRHVDVNLQDGQGQTALHLALKERRLPIARLFLQQDTQRVDLVDQFGRLPLHWAAQAGYDEVLPQCMQGVDVNAATQGGDTPLHWAVTDGHTLCALQLLQRGARVGAENGRGESVVKLSRGKGAELERLVAEADEVERKAKAEAVEQRPAEVASFQLPSTAVDAAPPPGKKAKMTIKLKPKK